MCPSQRQSICCLFQDPLTAEMPESSSLNARITCPGELFKLDTAYSVDKLWPKRTNTMPQGASFLVKMPHAVAILPPLMDSG